ncbi:apoptosis regulator E10 [Equid gammaherpesvirus 2]|nr:apoptosis regulator E10 [Equid gammaherpesvirus 2]
MAENNPAMAENNPQYPTLTEDDIWDIQKCCLENLRVKLCTGLKPERHYDHLRAKKILSREDTEEISDRVSSRLRSGLLIDHLRQHPCGFEGLVESCNQEQGQEHLGRLLEKEYEKEYGRKLTEKFWDTGAGGRSPFNFGGGDGSEYTDLLPPNDPRREEDGGSRNTIPNNSQQSEIGGGGPYNFGHDGEKVGGNSLDQGGAWGGAGCGGPNSRLHHSDCGDEKCEGCGSRYYEKIPEPNSFESSGESGGGGGGGRVTYHAEGDGRVEGLPQDPQENSDPSLKMESGGNQVLDHQSPRITRKFFCC